MKKWIIKRKIMKLLEKNPNQFFDNFEISDEIYSIWFSHIMYYTWLDIEECLEELISKEKIEVITDVLGLNRYRLGRRYRNDRFLYKG